MENKESAVIKWLKSSNTPKSNRIIYTDVESIQRNSYKNSAVCVNVWDEHWFNFGGNICERWNENIRMLALGHKKDEELNWYRSIK